MVYTVRTYVVDGFPIQVNICNSFLSILSHVYHHDIEVYCENTQPRKIPGRGHTGAEKRP